MRAARAGSASRASGVSQRSSTASATAAVPPSRTATARAANPASGSAAAVAVGHDPPDAIRVVDRHPHGDHPAERHADDMGALDAEAVEQRDDVAADVVDRVRPLRDRRPAVPARVDADDAEVLRECRDLGLPELERRAERGEQDDHRRVGRAVDDVVQVHRCHALASRASWAARARSMKTSVEPR